LALHKGVKIIKKSEGDGCLWTKKRSTWKSPTFQEWIEFCLKSTEKFSHVSQWRSQKKKKKKN
jgi:hypothetical protein